MASRPSLPRAGVLRRTLNHLHPVATPHHTPAAAATEDWGGLLPPREIDEGGQPAGARSPELTVEEVEHFKAHVSLTVLARLLCHTPPQPPVQTDRRG